jgi:hypothetical protein
LQPYAHTTKSFNLPHLCPSTGNWVDNAFHPIMVTKDASLSGLPVELVLEILHHFRIIRCYEMYPGPWTYKSKENTRQFENNILQQSLRSVCLTSRLLNRIAIPMLYASFTGSVTRYGLKRLRLFRETTMAFYFSGGNCIEHLQYVEVRISATRRKSLYADSLQQIDPSNYDRDGSAGEEVPDAAHLAAYYHLLADIIRWAPNLQHIFAEVPETSDVSFWKHLIHGQSTTTALTTTTVAGQGFDKLRTLCLPMRRASSLHSGFASFRRITPLCPGLRCSLTSELMV